MDDIITRVKIYIVNPALSFLFVLAFAYFLWGVFQYFLYRDSDTERETGKKHILWGLVGLVIMVSFYGIMRAIGGTFGVSVPHP